MIFDLLFCTDHFSKHYAAWRDRQFVEHSEMESVRMGEFTKLSEKAPIALRDCTQFQTEALQRGLAFDPYCACAQNEISAA
jgi:hypothetical protein